MLKTTGLSLLLGAAALLVCLGVFFGPDAASDPQSQPIVWSATKALVGALRNDNDAPYLVLENRLDAAVQLTDATFQAENYPYLHLSLATGRNNSVALQWHNAGQQYKHRLENRSHRALWMASGEMEGWNGEISDLRLSVFGPLNSEVAIHHFGVYPASFTRQLLAIYSDLTAFVPWKRAAMNTHKGVTRVSSFYPMPLAALLLLCGLLGYGALLLIRRKMRQFSWRVTALIFLTCWILLDLSWQLQLLRQLAVTHDTFAGKTSAEKLAVGPDWHLYQLVSELKQYITEPDARVFVGSSDEYKGLRGAYYLYPYNVYWSLEPPEIPHPENLRSGDYIVVLEPSAMRVASVRKQLNSAWYPPIKAEPLFHHRKVNLVRVK